MRNINRWVLGVAVLIAASSAASGGDSPCESQKGSGCASREQNASEASSAIDRYLELEVDDSRISSKPLVGEPQEDFGNSSAQGGLDPEKLLP